VTDAANDAFIHGMDRSVIVGTAVALMGAAVAYLFLPARARVEAPAGVAGVAVPAEAPVDGLVDAVVASVVAAR
jgi:hypothetical protein